MNDYAYAVSGQGDSIYVLGITFGALPGQTGMGGSDIFLTKFDTTGREMWTRQFGSVVNDYAYSVYADASGAFVAGTTYGQMGQLCGLGGCAFSAIRHQRQRGLTQFGTDVNDYANAVQW
jgi:hypothetical protein